ncbi:MAG: hypothetical protein C4555_00165 [Dehalococcoidia bacterium]|nr:MAG: hypothetical protein C4555_00165 [Dehalococcoidia bacterium]
MKSQYEVKMTTEKPQDETIIGRISDLLAKGYTRQQLTKDMGFAERTVDAAIKKRKLLSSVNDEDDTQSRTEGDESPKSAKTNRGTDGRDGAIAIRKEKESVLPEWLEADVAEIFDGNLRDRKIFLAGMSVPMMGLRLFSESIKPLIDLMTTWQEGQARAARAAQGSSLEIAQEAGETAATAMGKFLMENKPWLTKTSDPMKAMMAQAIQPHLSTMLGRMFSMLSGITQPPGTTIAPVQSSGNIPSGGAAPEVPGPGQASDEELKEVFGDD